jgi:hypothetical protein
MPTNLTIDWSKATIHEEQMFLFLRTDANAAKLEGRFRHDHSTGGETTVPMFRSMDRAEHMVIVPAKPGQLTVYSEDPRFEGYAAISDHDIAGVMHRGSNVPATTGPSGSPPAPAGKPPAPNGSEPVPTGSQSSPFTVRMDRSAAPFVRDEYLTKAIQDSSDGLSFARFQRFVELAFCDDPISQLESSVRSSVGSELTQIEKHGTILRADSFERLQVAADIFVSANARLWPADGFSLNNAGDQRTQATAYLTDGGHDPDNKVLPYLRLVYDQLGIRAPDDLRGAQLDEATKACRDSLERRQSEPCLIELIWSYWHEEAMQSQAMAAINQRFQNRRAPGDRDPLAQLEIDPLRPLNHLMWGFAQSENDRLSVLRRAHEYEHEYGFPLHGKALGPLRPADRRSKFLEAFHNLLYRCVQFYKEDDDTTHVADGFPVLNALKETHYVLAQGAHNQFGDLPAQARKEMLVEQWILSRTEMREFLGSRPMVAYPETWMSRVDTVKTLKGWTDVSVVHFHDLAVFGEQMLLSIRWPALSKADNPDVGKAWARDWRAAVQGYIHALRATLGIDLAADITNGRDESERYLPPSVHLRRRLQAQAVAAR